MWNSRHFACSLLMASGTLGWGGRAGVSELAAQGINQNNAGGIRIDAEGIVRLAVENDSSGTLDRQRREAASKQRLPADMAQPASQRLVSLVRVEQQIENCLKESQSIPDEIFFLAGLQRIDHIFVFPEDRDLVIAGPADGFSADATGRMIGVESRRPVLRLDDLSVALRTIPVASQIGCSIDPVPERLAALQNFIRTGKPANAAAVEARFQKMDDLLGLQEVRIDGVPADSHFGLALVEADYRMKRVSIGLENLGIKGFKSHLATLGAAGNTMQRWWFVPYYEAIQRSQDGLAFQFDGQRVQLLSQEELIDGQGNRFAAAKTRLSTQAFAAQFTEKYPELAAKSPVFAELQNLIDISLLAAIIHTEHLADRIDWKMSILLDGQRFKHPTFNVPKNVASSVNYKKSGKMIIGLVAGGVTIRPQDLLRHGERTPSDNPRLDSLRTETASAKRLDAQSWWWDVNH